MLSLDTAGPLIPAKDLGGLQARYALVGAPNGLSKIQDSHQEVPLEGEEEEAPEIEVRKEDEEEEKKDGSDAPKAKRKPAATHLQQEEEEVEEEELPEVMKEEIHAEKESYILKNFRLAIPLRSKNSKLVAEAAMEMVIRLRADGYHVHHVHADQGHEFSGAFRTWCKNRAIRMTRTPGDSPQSNGRAEAAVKAIKTQVRRLLFDSGQGHDKWPWAMRYINELLRAKRIGEALEIPPFYSEVLIRKRAWKRGSFEPTSEVVNYLTPAPEDHGHYVQPPGERPCLTRCFMRKASTIPDERKWPGWPSRRKPSTRWP